jgi:protein TonB
MATAIRYRASADNLPPGFHPRRDNFSTMLFIAALFHGVIILGVTFTAGDLGESISDNSAVEVVLLTREYEKRPDNVEAEYIAQQNLAGTGNTTEDEELRVSYGRDAFPAMPGPERDGVERASQREQSSSSSEQLLYARVPDAGTLNQRTREGGSEQAPQRTGMPGSANTIEILAPPDNATILQGAGPRQLVISANTRESRIAAYLDSWKRRVERVGTINFPRELLQDPNIGNPVLQVNIAASGKLTDVIILTSSGSQELDMAAVEILRLAAPFDKFPEYLRNDYDSLGFSYEWRFTGRSVSRMRVPR